MARGRTRPTTSPEPGARDPAKLGARRAKSGAGKRRPEARHWLRFGPGLVLALIASLLVWRQFPPAGGGPPRLERTRLDAIPNPPPSAPDPAWLLEQRDALRLTAPQMAKLSRLRARWDRDTRALRVALDHASAEFDRSMGGAGGPGQTMEQLQERAAPVSHLSRQLTAARRAWWSEAATVLTAAQRRRAEEAWARRLLHR
jgi:hypothetical protein